MTCRTPATRAAIIEGLILEKYMVREGRELVPTAKAFQLMTLLRGLDVEDLTKPELTGDWEYRLAEMEHGRLKRDAFGGHRLERAGQGGERDETTKPYAFGDPFHLDLRGTLSNALMREENAVTARAGQGVHLAPEDFEVYRTAQLTRTATVLLVDMSRSMLLPV